MGKRTKLYIVCLVLFPLALTAFVVGFACPVWIDANGENYGLWQNCKHVLKDCSSLEFTHGEDWEVGVRSVEVFALVMLAVAGAELVLENVYGNFNGRKLANRIAPAVLCIIGGLGGLIGVIVFTIETKDVANSDYGWAMMTCAAGAGAGVMLGVGFFVSGVWLERLRNPDKTPINAFDDSMTPPPPHHYEMTAITNPAYTSPHPDGVHPSPDTLPAYAAYNKGISGRSLPQTPAGDSRAYNGPGHARSYSRLDDDAPPEPAYDLSEGFVLPPPRPVDLPGRREEGYRGFMGGGQEPGYHRREDSRMGYLGPQPDLDDRDYRRDEDLRQGFNARGVRPEEYDRDERPRRVLPDVKRGFDPTGYTRDEGPSRGFIDRGFGPAGYSREEGPRQGFLEAKNGLGPTGYNSEEGGRRGVRPDYPRHEVPDTDHRALTRLQDSSPTARRHNPYPEWDREDDDFTPTRRDHRPFTPPPAGRNDYSSPPGRGDYSSPADRRDYTSPDGWDDPYHRRTADDKVQSRVSHPREQPYQRADGPDSGYPERGGYGDSPRSPLTRQDGRGMMTEGAPPGYHYYLETARENHSRRF